MIRVELIGFVESLVSCETIKHSVRVITLGSALTKLNGYYCTAVQWVESL